jgi:hypothetical protein
MDRNGDAMWCPYTNFCHRCATTDNLMKVNKVNTDGDITFLRYDAASTGNWIPVLWGKASDSNHLLTQHHTHIPEEWKPQLQCSKNLKTLMKYKWLREWCTLLERCRCLNCTCWFTFLWIVLHIICNTQKFNGDNTSKTQQANHWLLKYCTRAHLLS